MNEQMREEIAKRLQPEYRGSFRAERSQFIISEFPAGEIDGDFLNRAKEIAKRHFGRCYPALIRLISPVYSADMVSQFIARGAHDFFLNLGSGMHDYPRVILLHALRPQDFTFLAGNANDDRYCQMS